jgi:hypothetical protein
VLLAEQTRPWLWTSLDTLTSWKMAVWSLTEREVTPAARTARVYLGPLQSKRAIATSNIKRRKRWLAWRRKWVTKEESRPFVKASRFSHRRFASTTRVSESNSESLREITRCVSFTKGIETDCG